MKKALILGILGIFSISFAGTEVKKIVCGEKVENREVINPSDTFPSNIGKIYCMSYIKTDEAPTTIYHIWSYKGKEMRKIELPVKVNSENYRVWSEKRVLPSWKGNWEIKVLDKNGKELGKKEIKVE